MVNNSSAGAPIASLGDTATDEWGEDVHGGADMGDSDVDAESEEILICDAGAGSDADAFDQIIGRLDVLLMDDGFHEIADGFVAISQSSIAIPPWPCFAWPCLVLAR